MAAFTLDSQRKHLVHRVGGTNQEQQAVDMSTLRCGKNSSTCSKCLLIIFVHAN